MNKLFQILDEVLPIELCHMIISYTYTPQSISLTTDIKNYCATKTDIINLYKEEIQDDYDGWLSNDLIGYANRNVATIFGLTDDFYVIFLKYIQLKTREQVDAYFITLMDKDMSAQINIMWGLFTVEDRAVFYDIMS
jgi:hypothetical protein